MKDVTLKTYLQTEGKKFLF